MECAAPEPLELARSSPALDCVGIGIGPSNLSLACLLDPIQGLAAEFVEQKPVFAWHPGMLIPGTTIQVAVTKDLVSLVDPTSKFGFFSFLHSNGRLYHFLNARFEAVSRVEFEQYLKWACAQLRSLQFSQQVQEVEFRDGFIVRTQDRTVAARNIVLGVGQLPKIPACAVGLLNDTLFHSAEYLTKMTRIADKRIVVIGGGQSGAEIVLDLISRRRDELPAEIVWVSRRLNVFPLDDSPFVNDQFAPTYSAYFSTLPGDARNRLIREQKLSSDGVSMRTLELLYRALYEQRFIAANPLPVELRAGRELRFLSSCGKGWRLGLHADPDRWERTSADVVILCTGYGYQVPEFLGQLRTRLERAGPEIAVNPDFSARWDGPSLNRIFVQNGARLQRGLADPNLSLNAWRSATIVNALVGRSLYKLDCAPPFVQWAGSQRRCPASTPKELWNTIV